MSVDMDMDMSTMRGIMADTDVTIIIDMGGTLIKARITTNEGMDADEDAVVEVVAEAVHQDTRIIARLVLMILRRRL